MTELPVPCRANVGGARLRRCGKPSLRALVVCAEHFDQHEILVKSYTVMWFRLHGWCTRRDRRLNDPR